MLLLGHFGGCSCLCLGGAKEGLQGTRAMRTGAGPPLSSAGTDDELLYWRAEWSGTAAGSARPAGVTAGGTL